MEVQPLESGFDVTLATFAEEPEANDKHLHENDTDADDDRDRDEETDDQVRHWIA